jgi:glycosyltransferase involved in cell wall biosynthesis
VRIAYLLTRGDAVGGASIHVRDMGRAMAERGHEVIVFTGGDGHAAERLRAAGLAVKPLAFLRRQINPLQDYRALRETGAALREWGPDLVSAHTAKAGWLGRAACSRLGIPVVYTPHGWAIGDRISRWQGEIFLRAERMAARWSDAIICVCEYERQLALEKAVAPPEKLRVVYNGVADVPEALRANPAPAPARVVSVARFEPPKDHATLLAAMARLGDLPWELDLVGEGPLEASVRALASELGIAGRVHFRGYDSDPAAAFASAQLFVLSSRSEGFPRSILEAMRAGLPVAASRVGGVGEAVANGENGFLAEAGDVEGLAAAIRRLVEDVSVRQRLGRAARLAYEEKFALERTVEQTADVYRTVLGGRLGEA